MKSLLAVLLTGLAAAAPGELLYEPFDGLAPGAITNYKGWTSRLGSFTNTIPANVSNLAVYTLPRALDLPVPPGGQITNTMAAYTNFSHRYVPGSNHPVVRFSTMLYLTSTSRDLFVGLGDRVSQFLRVTQDPADGTVKVNDLDTGAALPTGELANLTVYFNLSNRQVAVDGPSRNILPWTDSGLGAGATQFTVVSVMRSWKAGSSGVMAFDDIVFEAFAPATLGWWRMGDGLGLCEAEQTGRFTLTNGYFWERLTADIEPVHDGRADARNLFCMRAPQFDRVSCPLGSPVLSNWTVEAVHRFTSPFVFNHNYLDWGWTTYQTTNSRIGCGWLDTSKMLFCTLRDQEGTEFSYVYGPALADDRDWHHIAFVKNGGQMTFYVDYEPVGGSPIDANGDGNYVFPAGSVASIGVTLNGGNSMQTNDLLDEVRVSAGALTPAEFLMPSRPVIQGLPANHLVTNWPFEVQTIPGKTYHVCVGEDLVAAGWNEIKSFVAADVWTVFTSSAPTEAYGMMQIRRDP
jgi:hypothetical protein